VNPNPGWCWDGHLAKMAKFAGILYDEMLKMILQAAEERLKLLEEAELEKNQMDEQKRYENLDSCKERKFLLLRKQTFL